jgi:uncharacterized protein (DUF1330 family)
MVKTNYKIAIALVAGAAIGGAAIQGLHAQAKPPSLLITDITEITNPDGFKAVSARPQAEAAARIKAGGGTYLARTDKIIGVDGAAPKRMIIIAFDSLEKAQAFNNTAGQKEVNEIRSKNTKSRSFIIEGMAN